MSNTIASTIRSQIEMGVLWSLGALSLYSTDNGLAFDAKIIPFNAKGQRLSNGRKMLVKITLNALDYYDIEVTYADKRRGVVTHASVDNVDVSSLNRTLLALDYDGDEVFNPRYV